MKLQPLPYPWKVTPLFSSNSFSKLKSSQAPLFEDLVGGSTSPAERSCAHYVYQESIHKVNTKKTVGISSILPKLKLAAEPSSQPVTEAINMTVYKTKQFSKQCWSCIPLDEGKSNKYISNFRSVSVLNTFSKIYKQVIKKQIILGPENFLSPEILTYRKSYSTQHIITFLIEDWQEKPDQNFLVALS